MFEPRMAGSHQRQARAATTGFFNQLLQTAQRLAMPITRRSDESRRP
jgi:hypothetical protein